MFNDTPLLIDIKNITVRLRDRDLLPETSLEIRKGENYLVTGKNGSGKTTLMRVLTGESCLCRGSVKRFHKLPLSKYIVSLSFEKLKKLLRSNDKIEESEYYSGKALMPEISFETSEINEVLQGVESLSHEKIKGKKICHLSNGELRKYQILKAFSSEPEILILDEPFDGLDLESRKELKEIIKKIGSSHISLFIVTHSIDEIPDIDFRHISIYDGKVHLTEIINLEYFDEETVELSGVLSDEKDKNTREIINISDAKVSYRNKNIFSNLDFKVNLGEKWVILGENGCGKSTLLSLINGDHLQAYSNNIEVFGRKRGTGESLWEIKKNIGFISSDFHFRYDKNIEAYKVLLSGYFDSTGLYEKPSRQQIKKVDLMFDKFQLGHLYNRNFRFLSYGQQRILLVLRALVKDPQLVIMDEPCHGLDHYNRNLVLNIARAICKIKNKSLIYVTHSLNELDFHYDFIFKFIKDPSSRKYVTKIKKS